MVRPHVAGYEPAMAVRDQTRVDRITGAFRRGMSTEEVGKAFGISAVRVSQILRDSDVRLGRERPARRSDQTARRPGSD